MSRLAALLPTLLLLAASAAPAAAEEWLSYDRSGGITGWSLKVLVSAEGRVEVAGTRQDPQARERRPLEEVELLALRRLVAESLAAPERKLDADPRRIADGMRRVLTVQSKEGRRVLLLPDGARQLPSDRELLLRLEELARRPAPGAPTPAPEPPKPEPRKEPAPRIDVVLVSRAPESSPPRTALLLELPVGRADERPEAHGAIELLLLIGLDAKAGVLLDGRSPLEDVDTGSWSISVTPARTRLLVELAEDSPAAARGATAELQAFLHDPTEILGELDAAGLDHQRRRLAAAVHHVASDPRGLRTSALREAAWGAVGASPTAFEVHAVTRADLLRLAGRIRKGHPRLLASGPLARTAADLVAHDHRIQPRGPLDAPAAAPLERAGADRNEHLIALAASPPAVGLPAAVALEIAQRRHSTTWIERVEPGDVRRSVPGDTLAVVGPAEAVPRAVAARRLENTLRRLSLGLQQSVVDTRLQRRRLGGEPREPAARVRAAADLLELGLAHPVRSMLDLEAAGRTASPSADEVRAAAAALADGLRELGEPKGEAEPGPEERRLLESARRRLFGTDAPANLRGAVLTRRGRDSEGGARRLVLQLESRLPLRLEGGGDPIELSAGELPAGASAAARREQGLVVGALADPAVLVAAASAGLLPVRAAGTESLGLEDRELRCERLEVLVPARGSYRLLIDPESGDVRAVDRSDPFGRTVRVLMSDIRPSEAGRHLADRQDLVRPDGERELLLQGIEVELSRP